MAGLQQVIGRNKIGFKNVLLSLLLNLIALCTVESGCSELNFAEEIGYWKGSPNVVHYNITESSLKPESTVISMLQLQKRA